MSARAATTAGSLKRGSLLLVASLLLGLTTMASPALAARTHVFKGAIGAGELGNPAGLAVDSASGDLYVADRGNSTVRRFDAEGAPAPFTPSGTNELGPFTFPGGNQQVAVDNSSGTNAGHFYVADGTTVKAFDADGEPAPFSATAAYLSGNEITGNATGPFEVGSVAVDSEGDIYVSDPNGSTVRIYAPSGEIITSFPEEAVYPFLAVPDPSGITYTGNTEINFVEAFEPDSNPPTGSTTYVHTPLSFTPGSALAVEPGSGQVFSSDDALSTKATSITQYSSFSQGNGPIVKFGAEQLGNGVTAITVSGSGDVYVLTGAQVDHFGPLVTLADAHTEPATGVDAATGSATLRGTVDPNGIPLTECEFEYGPTAAYGQTVECAGGVAAVGAGERPKPVTAAVSGLAPGTYHFHLVVANANGESPTSGDITFSTEAALAPSACPNEALRVGPSALLPECRAYEMVSPPDKNGGRVFATYAFQAAESGDALQFLSTSSFAGAEANALNAYIARREGGNWTTHAIDAPQFNPGLILEVTSLASSEDLEKTFQISFRALAPGAVEDNVNLYLRNNATGARTLIATHPQNPTLDGEVVFNGRALYVGGTPDWSRLFLASKGAFTPGAVEGETNYYEFTEGQLKLVTAAAAKPQPYATEPGAIVSANGAFVYFVQGQSLFRYDVGDGTLTELTTEPNPEVLNVISVSEDGSRAYVYANGPLAPGSHKAPEGSTNLFAWHEGSGFTYVTSTLPVGPEAGGFHGIEASPDGRFLGIGTFAPLTSADVKSAACPVNANFNNLAEDCEDVYLYEAETGQLTCVSCSGPGRGFSSLGAHEQRGVFGNTFPRGVLNDGTILFDSPNRLVPRDANGVGDVYDWRDGKVRLISTGSDPNESSFVGATANGRDIFFRTAQRLVGQDTDAASDVYDARVDGGLAAQNPPVGTPPCEGQECRGAASSPPPPLSAQIRATGHSSCAGFAKRAKRLRAKAKRLKKKPAKTKASKRAKQLTRKANQCRRQGK